MRGFTHGLRIRKQDPQEKPMKTLIRLTIPASAITAARRHLAIAFALLTSVIPALHAEEAAPSPDKPAVLVDAVPLERKTPYYPYNERYKGGEAWVLVSYVVTVEGTVRDPQVIASSGRPAFEKVTLEVVPTWTFKPATLDGAPVEQSNSARINFTLDPASDGARSSFVSAFRQAGKALAGGDVEKARAIATRLDAGTPLNLYEDAWLWLLKSRVAEADKDTEQQLRSLRYATSDITYLSPETRLGALATMFKLELLRTHYAAALEIDNRVKKLKNGSALAKAFAPSVSQVLQLKSSPDALARNGRIADAAPFPWEHKLLRNAFGIDEVTGAIKTVDLRCKAQARRLEWAADRSWKIPPAWGECSVYVEGAPGTQFRLVEYAS
jgi:TonB family protein